LSVSETEKSAPYELLKSLVLTAEADGSFLIISSVINNLRYPNLHTFWSSTSLLNLFVECKRENIKEQITRGLIERIIGHQPHPWGVHFTLSELFRNPKYEFFFQGFTKSSPEVENIVGRIYKRILESFS
jgi:CCR4-NOT transcription complex subunit 1